MHFNKSISSPFNILCLSGSLALMFSNIGAETPVPDDCMGCLCQALTDCDRSRGCEGNMQNGDCGPLAITYGYWEDCRRPTVHGQDPFGAGAYQNCTTDYACSVTCAQNYMTRYKKDCNGDAAIDCKDFSAIHLRGPGGCGDSTGTEFGMLVQKCVDGKHKRSKCGQR